MSVKCGNIAADWWERQPQQSLAYLLTLGSAWAQDATGPRVPLQATFTFLPFFTFGASACRDGRWTQLCQGPAPLCGGTMGRGQLPLPPVETCSLSSTLVLSACWGDPTLLLVPPPSTTGGEVTGTASSSPGMPCASDKGTMTLSSPSLCIATERNANSPYPSLRDDACPLPRCQNLQMPALSRGRDRVAQPRS